MKTVRFASLFTMLAVLLLTSLAQAQDLGANIRKIPTGFTSTSGPILIPIAASSLPRKAWC